MSKLGRPKADDASLCSKLCTTAAGRAAIVCIASSKAIVYADANGIIVAVPPAQAGLKVYDMPGLLGVHRCVEFGGATGHAKATFPAKLGGGYTLAMKNAVENEIAGQPKVDWHLIFQAHDEIKHRAAEFAAGRLIMPGPAAAGAGVAVEAVLDWSFGEDSAFPLGMVGSHLRPGRAYCGAVGVDIGTATTYESVEMLAEHTIVNASRDYDDAAFCDDVLRASSLALNLPTCRCLGRLETGVSCSLWKRTVRVELCASARTLKQARGGAAAPPQAVNWRGLFTAANDIDFRP